MRRKSTAHFKTFRANDGVILSVHARNRANLKIVVSLSQWPSLVLVHLVHTHETTSVVVELVCCEHSTFRALHLNHSHNHIHRFSSETSLMRLVLECKMSLYSEKQKQNQQRLSVWVDVRPTVNRRKNISNTKHHAPVVNTHHTVWGSMKMIWCDILCTCSTWNFMFHSRANYTLHLHGINRFQWVMAWILMKLCMFLVHLIES